MRNLQEIKITCGPGQPPDYPAPTAEEIAEFEREFGVKLPPAYLALLRYANGGTPDLDAFVDQNRYEWVIARFFHLGGARDSGYCISDAMSALRPHLGTNALPFADNPYGHVFYIDLASGAVKLREGPEEEEIFLAPSFEAFIDRLEAEAAEDAYEEEENDKDDEPTAGSADRYAEGPMLRLLEFYVLWAIEKLSPADELKLREMEPQLSETLKQKGNWRDILASAMEFPPNMPDLIRKMWARNQEIARERSVTLPPQKFAEMFVDSNLKDRMP